jgi:predicted dehydrogenase
MNRREFVQASTAAAVVSLAQNNRGDQAPIKIGFLGATHPHAIGKWKALQENTGFELVGIADDSPEVRSSFREVSPHYLSQRDLLSQCQAIVVESAVRDHARHAKIALEAGRHVHVEKPPSATLAEFRDLLKIAERNACTLQLGYQWRYHAGFHKVFEAVGAGWLGKIYLVRASINLDLAPERRAEWAEFVGGGMFELGAHLIDPVLRLMGKPAKVTSHLKNHSETKDGLKDNNVVVFEFPEALGIVTNMTAQPNPFEHRLFEVLGSNGTMTLSPLEPPALRLDLAKPAGPYQAGNNEIPLPPFRRYIGDFAELAAVIRGEKKPSVSRDDDLLVHEWLLKACEMS